MGQRSFLFTSVRRSGSTPSIPQPTPISHSNPFLEHQNTDDLDTSSLSSYDSRTSTTDVTMGKAKIISSEPVVIPVRQRKDGKEHTRHTSKTNGHRPRDQHRSEKIKPAVAALLASTAIPRPKARNDTLRRNGQYERLTVDAVLNHNSDSEYSSSLEKSPLDLLLSPPEDNDDIDDVDSESGSPSYMTVSSESTPSLVDSSGSEASPSLGFPLTPSFRAKRGRPARKQEPIYSPPTEKVTEHPLSDLDVDIDDLDFRVFAADSESETIEETPKPRKKSAFKSNLTASLRALKSAAKTISNLTAASIPPDDFLTRSIISIDPRVPFTDERMPPRLNDTPTPALRRYLNPTTNAPIEAHVPRSLAQTGATKIVASIQMQTYKVSKLPKAVAKSKRTSAPSSIEVVSEIASGPVAKQRDMRENSDFIRVAVMEMLMRKNGKLAENVPGRARWALPPRQVSTQVYEIGADGVPVRWIAMASD